MLTDAEMKWLEERKNYCTRCRGEGGCPDFMKSRCSESKFPHLVKRGLYSLTGDYLDAAEFEARVAANLATERMAINWDDDLSCCPPEMTERECSKKRPKFQIANGAISNMPALP